MTMRRPPAQRYGSGGFQIPDTDVALDLPPLELSQSFVDAERQIQILEDPCPPRLQDERATAVGTHGVYVVADKNHRSMGPLDEQCVVALSMKSLVADGENLIDQVAFEFDREG
jgi:hypothetical protein